jgi:hypothetical protein
MVDSSDDRNDRSDKDRLSDRDRNPSYSRDYRTRPDAITLFERLGYDVTENDDVVRLKEDLRWVSEQRKKTAERKSNYFAFMFRAFIAIITVTATLIGQWVYVRVGGGK